MNELIDYLRKTLLREAGASLSDGQLLGYFLEQGDEAALAGLMRRHGPLVWDICRRVLGNHHDAEDAFQATFLVLVRRAASVEPKEMIANWLYGVAWQTARKAEAMRAKKRKREKQLVQMPEPAVPEVECGNDVYHHLHQALSGLPTKFRVSIILCYLEGKTRTEAARQLGVPQGTLAAWLARGRSMLAKRLARMGLVMSPCALTAELVQNSASASVPVSLASSTMQAASLLIADQAVSNAISTPVLSLMEGVMKEMFATKLKMTTTALLAVVAAAGLGSGGLAYHMQTAQREIVSEAEQPNAQQAPVSDGILPEQAVFAAVADDSDKDTLVGSGKEGKKEIKVADFNALDVHLPIHVSVGQAKAFNVVVTGDDNLLDVVKIVKEGSTLKMSAARRSWKTSKPLKVTVTMPALEQVQLDSASRTAILDFKSTENFYVRISAASSLEGSIEANNLKLDASGASKVKLKGSAKEAKLSASGACNVHLEDFALESANVKLSGACTAVVNLKSKLDFSLSGASKLQYQGNPTIGEAHSSGASSARRGKQ
jgi:RNA polymerase sigma factor (sigma-70 family)